MTRGQTAQLKKAFLVAFAQCGIVTRAALASGVGRTTVYQWQEHDEAFALGFKQAEVEATERLEMEAHRRAVDGLRRLKFDKDGAAILDPATDQPYTEFEYSDTLLIFLLKARAPEKYRERASFEHTGPGGTPLPAVKEIVIYAPAGEAPPEQA